MPDRLKPRIKMMTRIFPATLFLLATATPAFAHLDPAEHGSFAAGFSHPLFGTDHVLAMVAVGLWAWQIGGRALWLVPATFVIAMLAGFLLAMAGIGLPFVEPAILASVIGIGLLVALAVRLPLGACMACVAVFSVFHGHAHGSELGSATGFFYALGFALATALLHAAGLGVAGLVSRIRVSGSGWLVRLLGALTMVSGIALAFS
jgi:urease accessory protein